MKNKEKEYAYWLCSIPGIGDKTIEKLLKSCGGTAESVYMADRKCWERVLRSRQMEQAQEFTRTWRVSEEYDKLSERGIAFHHMEDKSYPQRLRDIPDAPYAIFVRGKLPNKEAPTVAIVGARDCSEYGRYVASELGKYLGSKGIQIISGMARGIDGIGQMAALEAGGESFGVLGCGVDICYPAGNRKLYEKLIANGGVLSSYPPGTLPKAQHFPPRNRIVSGLADVVVVIEARNQSGTLITVDMALEQGKEVYVAPGRITDKLSEGCNRLIEQGAGLLLSPQDFLEEIYELWRSKHRGSIQRKVADGTEQEKENAAIGDAVMSLEQAEIYKTLDFYPLSVEEIAAKLPERYNIVRTNIILMQLCMEGYARQLSPGCFCRSRKQNSILFWGNPL